MHGQSGDTRTTSLRRGRPCTREHRGDQARATSHLPAKPLFPLPLRPKCGGLGRASATTTRPIWSRARMQLDCSASHRARWRTGHETAAVPRSTSSAPVVPGASCIAWATCSTGSPPGGDVRPRASAARLRRCLRQSTRGPNGSERWSGSDTGRSLLRRLRSASKQRLAPFHRLCPLDWDAPASWAAQSPFARDTASRGEPAPRRTSWPRRTRAPAPMNSART